MMVTDINHTQLLLALKTGSQEAFAQVYHQYHQAVLANILRLVSNQHDAEDILQEVFIALWHGKHNLTERHTLAGWLFTASYYKSVAYLKKQIKQGLMAYRPEAHDDLLTLEPLENIEQDYAERLSWLHETIERLPHQKKLAFKLCRLEGKSYDEIAATLSISAASAKDYVKSASKLLKRHIALKQAATPLAGACLLHFFL
jgi:RNA polymerase sigma factor (sigma-70 family)